MARTSHKQRKGTDMIIFANKEAIDMSAVKSFGVSVKEGENPIGYFGTGLKYAISILIREGCSVTIACNGKENKFSSRKSKVRGKEFEFITMNGRKLPFTTELGKTWEMWQAMREIYSNCKDEDGVVFENELPGAGYKTWIMVDGEKFKEVWADRRSVFLESKPIFETSLLEIHRGESGYIYYQGIRAMELDNPSQYTYNMLDKMPLTEDRTIKNSFMPRIRAETTVARFLKDKQLLADLLHPKEDYWESTFNFSDDIVSPQWEEVVRESIQFFNGGLNKSAQEKYQNLIRPSLLEASTGEPSEEDKELINQGIEICKGAGFDVTEYPVRTAEFIGKNTMGCAHEGTIYVSRLALQEGETVVASTLLEEYVHLKYRLEDETRMLETFLFNRIVNLGKKLK